MLTKSPEHLRVSQSFQSRETQELAAQLQQAKKENESLQQRLLQKSSQVDLLSFHSQSVAVVSNVGVAE